MAHVRAMKQDESGPDLAHWVPEELRSLPDPQTAIPAIAKNPRLVSLIDNAVRSIPTRHQLLRRDSRLLGDLAPGSVHLVLTSPPYWTLKQYRHSAGQLGAVSDYETFLGELDRVWKHCFDALVPGGRLICEVPNLLFPRNLATYLQTSRKSRHFSVARTRFYTPEEITAVIRALPLEPIASAVESEVFLVARKPS